MGLEDGALLRAATAQFADRLRGFRAKAGAPALSPAEHGDVLQAGVGVCQVVGSLAAAAAGVGAGSAQPQQSDAVLDNATRGSVELGLGEVAQKAVMFGAKPAAIQLLRPLQVRKAPSWPRSWANFSPL